MKSEPSAWGLGVIVVALITAGAVRATSISVPERPAPEAATSTRPVEMLSTTVPKTVLKILRPAPLQSFSGFNVLRPTSAEPLSLPAMTVGEMMFIASPLALIPAGPNATTTVTDAEEPLTATPKVRLEEPVTRTPKLKARHKLKVAREEPQQQQQQQQQQLPWWSQLPWLRMR
jgi:hypothetical protein